MMCTRIHNLKFGIFRPSLFKYVISFVIATYQLVWVVCQRGIAPHCLSEEVEANRHGILYGHNTKVEELYRLEAQRHLHTHGIPVPADSTTILCISFLHCHSRYKSCRKYVSLLTLALLFGLTGRKNVYELKWSISPAIFLFNFLLTAQELTNFLTFLTYWLLSIIS